MEGISIPAWVGIGCWLAAMLWLAWTFVRAPQGYEDEEGFHRGRKPGEAEEIARLRDNEEAGAKPKPEAKSRLRFKLFRRQPK